MPVKDKRKLIQEIIQGKLQSETLRVLKRFHFRKLKFVFQCSKKFYAG